MSEQERTPLGLSSCARARGKGGTGGRQRVRGGARGSRGAQGRAGGAEHMAVHVLLQRDLPPPSLASAPAPGGVVRDLEPPSPSVCRVGPRAPARRRQRRVPAATRHCQPRPRGFFGQERAVSRPPAAGCAGPAFGVSDGRLMPSDTHGARPWLWFPFGLEYVLFRELPFCLAASARRLALRCVRHVIQGSGRRRTGGDGACL